MILPPVFETHAIGEQEPEKGTSYPHMVVLYSLQKQDSCLCDFPSRASGKTLSCNQ